MTEGINSLLCLFNMTRAPLGYRQCTAYYNDNRIMAVTLMVRFGFEVRRNDQHVRVEPVIHENDSCRCSLCRRLQGTPHWYEKHETGRNTLQTDCVTRWELHVSLQSRRKTPKGPRRQNQYPVSVHPYSASPPHPCRRTSTRGARHLRIRAPPRGSTEPHQRGKRTAQPICGSVCCTVE